ncbi:MAG: hypothetical protein HYR97_04075 [Candidatus Melainabacteria bacterium]|nr:hypothetical protein [Candidatus Melainabacteria bacterium]MBI3307860.1 hypothetical protein [Candidatus Melainabacteria bacterium]
MTTPIIQAAITLSTRFLTNPATANATREATRTIASQVAPAFKGAAKAAKTTVGQVVKRPDPSRITNASTRVAIKEVKHLALA